MAKKFLFALFLFAIQLSTTPIFANAESVTVRASEDCSAPAPDSLRITSIGTNFTSLAWVPAWMGATHTLLVQESDGSGGWTSMSVFQNIPGSTFLVDSLEPGTSYRYILATECPNGEVSQFKSIIDGVTLIVDLTIHGRTPLTPQQEVKCNSIPLNVNWKGFKVNYSGGVGAIESSFEIELDGSTDVLIKRVGLDNPIVAANSEQLEWPTCNDQVVPGGLSIIIIRLLNGGPEKEIAGVLDLSKNSSGVKICPDYDNSDFPWKNTYTVTGLIAARSSESLECIQMVNPRTAELETIQAQSPFQQTLRVFLNRNQTEDENIGVSLINLNGQVLFEQEYTTPIQELVIPTGDISVGLYVLKINCDRGLKTLKVLKVD